MVEFDKLPPKSRSLILATLSLEIASAHCTSIFDLARKRHQSMDELWRDVCRKTAQPHCSMPRQVLHSRYTAAPPPSPAAPPTPVAPPTGAPAASRPAKAAKAADQPAPESTGDDRGLRRQIVWLAGLAAVLVAGVALLVLAATSNSAPTGAGRPDVTVARAG